MPQAEFALTLHARLAAGPDGSGNLMWSPYSVASALALVAMGARGATRDELIALIAPGTELEDLTTRLGKGAEPGPHGEGTRSEMAVANTLWMRLDLPVLDSYLTRLQGWPGAAVRPADFLGDPEGARRQINAGVAQVTRGLIKDLPPPELVTRSTVAVLVNALWMKLAWEEEFDPKETRPRRFDIPGGPRDVATMQRKEPLWHGAADGWRMATLPGKGGLALDVVLPGEPLAEPGPPPLPSIEVLGRLYASRRRQKALLLLPRFEVGSAMKLNEPLEKAGVREMFTGRADLSAMVDPRARPSVSGVAHQAVLTVDEAGAVGAAATVVAVADSMPPSFVVDRPFLVLVRNGGMLLFFGQVTDPSGR